MVVDVESVALVMAALVVGVAAGAWWAGRAARALAEVRASALAGSLRDEMANHQTALSAARAELALLRGTLKSQVDAAAAAQRDEIARLEMHLVGALDEVEQLRRQLTAQPRSAGDTSQDYPATLPMQYQP